MSDLRRTPLFELQDSIGARFVPFAGWELPVQFTSIVDEHRAVRTSAGVFDVSHMGRLDVVGAGARQRLQRLLSNDLDRIQAGQAQYTLLLNERGGVVDDLIAYRRADDTYLLVVNAANHDAVVARLGDVVDRTPDTAMLAVQGPEALTRIGVKVDAFTWREHEVLGVACLVAGTGYTGERGCELICSRDEVGTLWDEILARGVRPCGLGARDTLRLEVCYPLHGQDISEDRDPYAAGLGWAVSSEKEFVGADALAAIRGETPRELLVAFVLREKGVPRAGMSILGGGTVSSGGYSPMLDVGIGLAYVPAERAAPTTDITVDIRGRHRSGVIVEKPIYRTRKEH